VKVVKIYRIARWTVLVLSVLSVFLLFKKPQPVAVPQPAAAAAINAQSFESKLEQLEQPRKQGQSEAEIHLNADEVNAAVAEGLEGIEVGAELIVITWLHLAERDILKTHPRNDQTRPLTGVFATRSPDRPNPLGLHRVTVREIAGNSVKVGPIEAIDGTPVVDIKPVLSTSADS